MRSETPAIEFRHVSLGFDGHIVLNDVSFKLAPGQLIIITGGSSSGKSVLLRLAMGFLKPDEGQVLIEGHDIGEMDEDELLTLRGDSMGVVFQEESLFTGLSVYDNTAYRLVEHHWSEEKMEAAVREVLRFVGLEEDAEKLPEELSGGMKRRLEIARGLVGWPAIMLLDEPTMGLDPLTAENILNLVIRARDVNKISALYVTKRIDELPYLATHYAVAAADGSVSVLAAVAPAQGPPTPVLLLEAGRIAFCGSAAEFEASTLPAVTFMTRGRIVAHDDSAAVHY